MPYIDIGGAKQRAGQSHPRKRKEYGGKRPPPEEKKGSAYKLRQVLSTGQNPILTFLPDLMHDDRRQGGFIVENSLVPFFLDLPSDEHDGGS